MGKPVFLLEILAMLISKDQSTAIHCEENAKVNHVHQAPPYAAGMKIFQPDKWTSEKEQPVMFISMIEV